MNESLKLSDLFFKIGVLTVENDSLRDRNADLTGKVAALEAQLEAMKLEPSAPTKRARKAPEASK